MILTLTIQNINEIYEITNSIKLLMGVSAIDTIISGQFLTNCQELSGIVRNVDTQAILNFGNVKKVFSMLKIACVAD